MIGAVPLCRNSTCFTIVYSVLIMLKTELGPEKSCACACAVGVNEENLYVDEVHEVIINEEDCLFPSLQFPVLHLNTSQSVPPLQGLLW